MNRECEVPVGLLWIIHNISIARGGVEVFYVKEYVGEEDVKDCWVFKTGFEFAVECGFSVIMMDMGSKSSLFAGNETG